MASLLAAGSGGSIAGTGRYGETLLDGDLAALTRRHAHAACRASVHAARCANAPEGDLCADPCMAQRD